METLKAINQRLEEVKQWFKKMNERSEQIGELFKEANQALEGMVQRFKETNQRLGGVNQRLEDIIQGPEEKIQRQSEEPREAPPGNGKEEASNEGPEPDMRSSFVTPVAATHGRKQRVKAAKEEEVEEINSEDTYERRVLNNLPAPGSRRKRKSVNYRER